MGLLKETSFGKGEGFGGRGLGEGDGFGERDGFGKGEGCGEEV